MSNSRWFAVSPLSLCSETKEAPTNASTFSPAVVKQSTTWHLNLKIAGSSPLTDGQILHLAALYWPRLLNTWGKVIKFKKDSEKTIHMWLSNLRPVLWKKPIQYSKCDSLVEGVLSCNRQYAHSHTSNDALVSTLAYFDAPIPILLRNRNLHYQMRKKTFRSRTTVGPSGLLN